MAEFSPQIIAQQVVFGLIQGFAQFLGMDFEGQPSMITTGNVIALRATFTTLAFFRSGQLFETSMQFFDLPTHITHLLSNLRVQCLLWAVRNHPVNVAICSDYLE